MGTCIPGTFSSAKTRGRGRRGRKEGRKGLSGGDRDGEWARRNEGKGFCPFLGRFLLLTRFVSFTLLWNEGVSKMHA